MIFYPIKKTKHSLFTLLFKKNPTFLVQGLDKMILQFRESGNYRTSAMKLVFWGKLMNHLLPMTGRKSTCLYPYVMNFYEVKFAVYKKYTFSCCRYKIIECRIQTNALLKRQSLGRISSAFKMPKKGFYFYNRIKISIHSLKSYKRKK